LEHEAHPKTTLPGVVFQKIADQQVTDGPVVSPSSQRRPRAMAATNVARVSERICRACCGGIRSFLIVISHPGIPMLSLHVIHYEFRSAAAPQF
jgi:hypothetical protein